MKNELYGLKSAWSAEKLKLKGSNIVTLVLIMGIAIPALFILVEIIESGDRINDVRERLPFNYFIEKFKRGISDFGVFFMPLTLILITARLSAIEHKSDTWKLVETQPVSRLSFWLVKWAMAALFSMVTIVVFFIASLLFNAGMIAFENVHEAASFSIPFGYMAAAGFRLWLAGLGIITLQLAFSMVVRNTIWPMVIGVVALIVATINAASQGALASFWPYALTGYTSRFPEGSEVGYWLLPSEWQALLWLLMAPLAFLLYRYRGSFRQSFRNQPLWGLSLFCILLLVAGSWWVQKPAEVKLIPGRTVIAGVIRAKVLPDSVEVFTSPTGISMQKAAVRKDGTFHINLQLNGDAEELIVRTSPQFGRRLYAGNGDSVFLHWTQGTIPGLQEIKLSGTAIATNQFLNASRSEWSIVNYYLENPALLPDPLVFYDQLMKEWKEKHAMPGKFRTADGMGLSATMRTLQEKLIAADYLKMALYQYPEKKNIDLKDTAYAAARQKLQPLMAMLQPFEQQLVGWKQYHDYLYLAMTKNVAPGQNEDSAYVAALMQQPAGAMRDRLVYDFSLKRLEMSRDSAARTGILADASMVSDKRIFDILAQKVSVMNRLRMGQRTPFFAAHTVKGDTVSLASLKGKYVVIDVWATWCAPCRVESPLFERISQKYKNDPVVFLALSVDQDRLAWQQDVKRKNTNVLQWRTQNYILFNQLYGVEGIPHFILIDPKGKFVNAQFPRPSDPNFEIMLRQALKLKAEEG